LVDGESRLTAVLELIKEGLDIKTVPVIQVTANNEADRIAIAVGANTGKPLSEWELGGAFKRLVGFGWSNEDIAAQFGMNAQKVAKCIELADMPQDVKQLLSERAITPALAITTVRRKGTAKATEELKEKAADAKAKGKKTAKAEKAPSKKEVAAGEWEKVGRAIYQSIEESMLGMEKAGADQFDWVEVRTTLLKKLGKLVNGTK
jgi:ParB-like chromosome segregation protein Spo0J